MINNLREQYAVPALCRQLHVSPSGYYRWQLSSLCTWAEEGRLELEIIAAHARTRGTHGASASKRILRLMG